MNSILKVVHEWSKMCPLYKGDECSYTTQMKIAAEYWLPINDINEYLTY